MKHIIKPWLKSLSGLFINFSALWFGILFTTPIIFDTFNFETALTLTMNIGFGIVYLLLSVETERILEYEY